MFHPLRICICLSLLVAVGCGQGTIVEGDGAVDRQAIIVPATFGTRSVAATDSWMVGVTSQPYSNDELSTLVLVDLRDQSSKTVSGPVFDGSPVSIGVLVAEEATFVGIGTLCQGTNTDEGCSGAQKLLRLDPVTEDWELEDLPFERNTSLYGLWILGEELVAVGSEAGVVTVARRNASGEWSELSKLETPLRPSVCATDANLWLFARLPGQTADPSGNDATFTLTRIDLASGQAENIDLPDLAGYFGGVTTEFGCGQNAPFVASTPAGSVPPIDSDSDKLKDALTGVTVYKWTDRAWQPLDVAAFDGHTVPDEIVSGPIPLLLGAEMIGGTNGNRPIAVLLGEDGGRHVATNGTDSYVWRGSTGDLIRIFEQGSQRHIEIIAGGS